MTITNQNVKIYRGNNAQLKVTLTTAEGDEYAPSPGDEVKYRLTRNAHSPEEESFISKELDAGITIAGGIATIELSPTETDLDPGIYYHELKIVDPPLEKSTGMVGTVVIKPSLRMEAVTP
jgi:hypothetical protein